MAIHTNKAKGHDRFTISKTCKPYSQSIVILARLIIILARLIVILAVVVCFNKSNDCGKSH